MAAIVVAVLATAVVVWWRGPPRGRSGPVMRIVAARDQVRLFALGDVGSGTVAQMDVARAMERRCQEEEVSGILLLGDNFYPSGVRSVEDPQWQSKFEIPYGSPCLSRLPVYAILGNHDILGDADAQILYGAKNPRWIMPARFYQIDFGDILRVVAVDTEFFDVCGIPWLCMFDFMRDALRAPVSPAWRLVMAHRPMTSASAVKPDYFNHPFARFIQRILCDRADVYVSGHAHHLELRRLEDCGTTFVVAGGGGAHLYPIRRGDPHVKFAASEHGFTDLLFWAGGARVTFWNTHGDKLYENEVVR